jgi:hypothetical protein
MRVLDMTAIVLLVPLFSVPTVAGAACVNPGGTDGCHATIQAAVDASVNGETVNIAAGTYVGNVHIGAGRMLTLEGAGATTTIVQGAEPVLDGEDVIAVRGVDTTVLILDLTIEGSTLERSLVTAANFPVTLIIENCTVTGSSTLYGYPAIAGATVVHRTLVQGAATGVVLIGGSTLDDSVVRGNGYGVALAGSRGRKTIRRSEITDGRAGVVSMGGGFTRVWISDSTISGHDSPGIVLLDRAKLNVERTTIADNGITPMNCCGTPGPPTAGGIWVSDGNVRVKLRSSILINEGTDCAARDETLNVRFRSSGFNVLQAATCGDAKDSDSIGLDPLLDDLANNGGGSRTHALLPGSPAIARVTSRCRYTDQRGEVRQQPCDSGAFEAP